MSPVYLKMQKKTCREGHTSYQHMQHCCSTAGSCKLGMSGRLTKGTSNVCTVLAANSTVKVLPVKKTGSFSAYLSSPIAEVHQRKAGPATMLNLERSKVTHCASPPTFAPTSASFCADSS